MKTIFNIDKVRICLQQPEYFYDNLYNAYHNSPNSVIDYDGFYLAFDSEDNVNDKDITAKLFLEDKPPVELGTFTFNKSKKYGSKCFFSYATKSLYEAVNYVYEGKDKCVTKYNYFTYPFFAFDSLGLIFNNVTSIEIACDTEASVISRIQYAVGKPDVFDMILLWKKVKSPEEILDGYWEYYQRSRLKKAPRPSLYIHSAKYEAGNNCTLKVYDKARELAQSRKDKEVLTRAWNGMEDKIQRMEISVENKQFKRFFQDINAANPDKWLYHNPTSATREQKMEEYRQGLEHFFYDLGMNEDIREAMFDYFSNHLLHFKLRNHEKTQVSILDLSVNSLTTLRKIGKGKSKPLCKPNKNSNE